MLDKSKAIFDETYGIRKIKNIVVRSQCFDKTLRSEKSGNKKMKRQSLALCPHNGNDKILSIERTITSTKITNSKKILPNITPSKGSKVPIFLCPIISEIEKSPARKFKSKQQMMMFAEYKKKEKGKFLVPRTVQLDEIGSPNR